MMNGELIMKKGYKMTEIGIVPKNWEVKKLGKIVDRFINGGTPSTQNSDFWKGNIPWITGADILNQKVGEIRRYITREAVKNSSTNVIKKGNLLLVTRTGVGKLAIAPFDISISQDFTGIYVKKDELLANYLFFFFDFNKTELQNQNQGTSIKGITRATLAETSIPFPPLPEQKAIAEVLSDTDNLIRALEKRIAKKRLIKQGAMQKLLTPKEDWVVKKLGEIGNFSKGQGIKKEQSNSGSIPCIRYGELYTKHNDYIKKFYSFISEEVAKTSIKLKNGNILFAGSGETKEEIGKCVAFINDFEAYAGGDIVIFSPLNVFSLFLGFLLNAPKIQKQKASRGQGDAVVHISASQLQQIQISLPPHSEQTHIATILSDMDSEIEALEKKLVKYKQLKQGLMQNLLTGKIRLI